MTTSDTLLSADTRETRVAEALSEALSTADRLRRDLGLSAVLLRLSERWECPIPTNQLSANLTAAIDMAEQLLTNLRAARL